VQQDINFTKARRVEGEGRKGYGVLQEAEHGGKGDEGHHAPSPSGEEDCRVWGKKVEAVFSLTTDVRTVQEGAFLCVPSGRKRETYIELWGRGLGGGGQCDLGGTQQLHKYWEGVGAVGLIVGDRAPRRGRTREGGGSQAFELVGTGTNRRSLRDGDQYKLEPRRVRQTCIVMGESSLTGKTAKRRV